jgi:hypothetical protein
MIFDRKIWFVLTVLASSGFAQQPENEKTEAVVPPRGKSLLLDHRLIAGTDNARLTLGTVKKHSANPLFGQELPWETDISHMYPNVIRIYYSGQKGKHSWQPGALCLATLRPDGWAGYEPIDKGQPATIRTTPVCCTGSVLSITADAAEGAVRVTALDADGHTLGQSEPVNGNVTDAPVAWHDGFELTAWKDRSIRLVFNIKQAKLYAFSFQQERPSTNSRK